MNKLVVHIKEILSASMRFVFLFTACIGVFICEWAVSDFHTTRVVNLIENIAFSCTLFAFFELFRPRIGIGWFRIVFYVLMVFSIVEGVYYLIFDAELSSSAIFIALDTNTSEVSEFLDFNLNNSHYLYVLGVVVSYVISWLLWAPRNPRTSRVSSPLLFFVIVLGVFLLSKPKIYQYNFPYVLTNSLIEYNQEQKLLEDIHANDAPFSGVVDMSESPNTHIVIIGESTSRLHFGLYGYKRNTTPKLEEIRDEIHLFEDVVSGHTYTVGSLVKALTIKKGDEYVGNIIQLFKQAGYKTYWLSNQAPLGVYETMVTKIGLSADETYFANSERFSKPTTYDQILLPKIDLVLNSGSQQKVIFVHLLGAHADYKLRYPKQFSMFPQTQDPIQNVINEYDNAVAFTDFVVRKIIEMFSLTNKTGTVMFFSDHGEEVYDEIDFAGHPINGVFTKNMIEIPFLTWSNPKLDISDTIRNRRFILNDLPHTLADLYQVYSNEIDTTRSLFHDSFIERPRVVWDSIHID